jgi:small conductance mechanosensitive channel
MKHTTSEQNANFVIKPGSRGSLLDTIRLNFRCPDLDLRRSQRLRFLWSSIAWGLLTFVGHFTVNVFVASTLPGLALAQIPPLNAPNINKIPPGVEQRGTLESAPVTLDGQVLFRIASPTVFNRDEPGSQVPVEVRAQQIEGNIQRLLPSRNSSAPSLDPDTLEVVVQYVNDIPVLFVQDATILQPRPLVTVTDADVQYYALSNEELAGQWQDILERELRQAIALRQPEALKRQFVTVMRVLAGTVGITALLGMFWVTLGRRERYLRQQQTEEIALIKAQAAELQTSPELKHEKRAFSLSLVQHFGLQQNLQFVRFLRWLLFWAIAFTWAFGIAYSLNAFPQTRQFVRKLVVTPLVLLLAWFLVGLVNRLIDFSVATFIQNLAQERSLNAPNLQRITTIARVIKGLKMVLVYTIGVLWALQWLQLIPGSVLALGTVVALVISFAAQNLVRDLVNGFMILLEDQYRIGDIVVIGDKSGLVENLNLRITQLRSPDGNLITLPNSSIVEVENLSRDWARSDFRIEVAYDTDIDLALSIVQDTAEQMSRDPKWRDMILDTHEFFGVEHLSHTGIVIRIWIKTQPLKQWDVAMELRRRLKIAFDKHNIQIGTPRQIWLQNGADPNSPFAASLLTDP